MRVPAARRQAPERLYEELRRVAEKKPVVAVVGTVAASGAYIAALAADTIVARGNSLVGSIGVLFQYPNVSKLLNNWGVEVETIKSSPLKAAPNGLEPTSPEAREAVASLVADSYAWFKNLVRERRNLDEAELAKVSDGRVFTARQGVPLKLVDLIGGQREADRLAGRQQGNCERHACARVEEEIQPGAAWACRRRRRRSRGSPDWSRSPVF